MMCKDCQYAGLGSRSRGSGPRHRGEAANGNERTLPVRAGGFADRGASLVRWGLAGLVLSGAVLGAAAVRGEASVAAAASANTGGVAGVAEIVSVQLWPTAVATGDRIVLEDIARISAGADGSVAGSLRLCDVAAAPPPGGSVVLTFDDVIEAFSRAGVNPTQILLRGSSRCCVSRPGRPAAARPAPAAAGASTTQPARGGAAGAAKDEAGTLGAAVRGHLEARVANLGGKAEIRFSPASVKALNLASPAYRFRIRPRGNDVLGLVTLEVDVEEGGRHVSTVPIVAEVTLLKTVVVTRAAVNRGEILQAKHLMLAERQFTRVSDVGLTDIQPLIGQETCRFIDAGGMITARDVRARPLVKRGDLVTVWVRQGDLVIKSVAKALRPGTYGESIEVKNDTTGESFVVTVTGPQTAELRRGGPAGGVAESPAGLGSGGAGRIVITDGSAQ